MRWWIAAARYLMEKREGFVAERKSKCSTKDSKPDSPRCKVAERRA